MIARIIDGHWNLIDDNGRAVRLGWFQGSELSDEDDDRRIHDASIDGRSDDDVARLIVQAFTEGMAVAALKRLQSTLGVPDEVKGTRA